ncbi:MAG: hypothetical protein NUV57_00305 [archaeon]|nr:hypothetical protein [archaeon]
MQLFKIANGPWEKLFSGVFQEHEVELYSNPEKILMIIVFEKKLDRIEGAIIELYKVFSAEGDVESFVETLPRDVLIITKHDEKSTLKFLLLGSKPTYARWVEDEFVKEVDLLVKKLSTSATMIIDVSKAYELTLKEISESSKEVQSAFFTQPMLVPLLATSNHSMVGETIDEMKPLTKGEIMLGLTRDRKKVIEPIALFNKIILSEGEPKDRARVLQVLAESAMLSKIPAIIFDSNKSFSGLGEANKGEAELKKYEVDIDPLGFPIKNYIPGKSVKVNLNMMSPRTIAELFGVGYKDFPRLLTSFLAENTVTSIDEMVEKISKLPQSEEFSEFEIYKTARIIKLMGTRYPDLFGGGNETTDMIKKSTSNIARASIIDISSLDERSSILIIHSIIKEISMSKQKSNSGFVSIIIPKGELIQAKENQNIISREIYSLLNELSVSGAMILIAAGKSIDIDQATKQDANVTINIVSGNDVGIQMKNRKSYRVLVRPTLSEHA